MGHDICGFRDQAHRDNNTFAVDWDKGTLTPSSPNGPPDDYELAYLRRNAGSESIHDFYEALGASDCDADVSGNGTSREFTSQQLKNALAILKDKEPSAGYYGSEIKFLEELIATGRESVVIGFS